MDAIDYRLSDRYLDPPDADENYVEKTIRLPHCYWCYEPPEGAPEVSVLPALSTFFSPLAVSTISQRLPVQCLSCGRESSRPFSSLAIDPPQPQRVAS